MKKRRGSKRSWSPQKSAGPRKVTVEYLLEKGTLTDLCLAKQRTEDELKFQWDYFAELAYQRQAVSQQISEALLKSCLKDFSFDKWQRSVRYKYSLHPLSSYGSQLLDGQRFNIGDMNPELIPSFCALYIAVDKDTAAQETLSEAGDANHGDMDATRLALMNPQSQTFVSVSGKLDRVFDLRRRENLSDLLELIKSFKVSQDLVNRAKTLGLEPPTIIRKLDLLHESVLEINWRNNPARFDLPSNSQIFGQLTKEAGIDGIIYPSVKSGKDCLAIFPNNFQESSSFIKLDDDPPDQRVIKTIDSSNWFLSLRTFDEIYFSKLH